MDLRKREFPLFLPDVDVELGLSVAPRSAKSGNRPNKLHVMTFSAFASPVELKVAGV
jgi:hypothetical protein